MEAENLKSRSKREEKPEAGIVFTSIGVSCSDETDEWGRKEYRTVYALQEIASLYVDVEGEVFSGAELTVALFKVEQDKSVCIAQQRQKPVTAPGESFFRNSFVFSGQDLREDDFQEGIYGFVAQSGETVLQSEPLFLMGGDGKPASYFRLEQIGIDKNCEETEAEAGARLHSFSCLDIRKLKDVRFYMLAENLWTEEWIYEFTVQLTGRAGRVKARHTIKGKQYISDHAGRKFLCFATELGEGAEHFWKEGEYRLEVYFLGQPVLALNFNIGQKEIGYSYTAEMTNAVSPAVSGNGKAKPAEDRNVLLDRLYRMVGLRKVKEEITRICEYVDFVHMRQENGFNDVLPPMHLLFCGNCFGSMNVVADMLSELFVGMGIVERSLVHVYGREDLVKEGYAAEEPLLRKVLAEAKGGILFLKQAGDFYDETNPQDRGRLVLELLLEILTKEKPAVTVILADTVDEITSLQQGFPHLKRYFSRQLLFEDPSLEEWLEIVRRKLEQKQFRLTPMAEDKVVGWLKENIRKNVGADDEEAVDVLIEEMTLRMSKRLMGNKERNFSKEDMMLITEADAVAGHAKAPGDSLQKLDTLVGAGPLKQSIVRHLNYIYFLQERRRQGFDDVLPPLHMIFSGNPGTGKLTVAKMMGEIYCSAGILSRPGVLVQNGANLADNSIPPEQMISALYEAANGGILYIGEAHLLWKTPAGLTCLELLLSYLSPERQEEMILILAADPQETDKILQVNPGLKVYFPYRFDFRDYTRQELLDLIVRKLRDKKYTLHPKAELVFKEMIGKAYGGRDRNFGNAVWVEKLVELTIRKMSDRIMQIRQERELTRKELTTILPVDVPVANDEIPGFEKDIFDEEEIGSALEELQRIVGQSKIKKQIREFVDLARHYSRQGIKLSTRMSLQWCFTGNSGMGKKAVARIIARLYKAMGIIESNLVFDFKAEKLLGRTEEEAQRMVGEALARAEGGVLLFDEDSRKLTDIAGVKERVRAILASQLAERPGNSIVIYAGSRLTRMVEGEEVEKGSDIINVLFFEDYTNEELMSILKRKLAGEQMELTASARKYMAGFIASLTATEERSHSSARLMRIVSELMIRNCIQRLAKKGHVAQETGKMLSVVKADVEMFTEDMIVSLLCERKKIGFN